MNELKDPEAAETVQTTELEAVAPVAICSRTPRLDALESRVREMPLLERLSDCGKRIGKMCSEGRPPRMTIPVHWDDDDFFIATTLRDAKDALSGANGGGEVAP